MIEEIASKLTDEQKIVLLAGDGEEVPAGIGTWAGLEKLGLLDDLFNTTPLGIAVVHHLLSTNNPVPAEKAE